MSLDIADDSSAKTTTQSWSLQTFDLPFQPTGPTGFAPHGDQGFTASQYLQIAEFSSRLTRNPYKTLKYDSATASSATMFYEVMDMKTLRTMIRNADFMKSGYSFFSTRLFYRMEIIGGPNYQGLLAYSAMNGLITEDARLAAIPFVDPASSTDNSKMRRLFYQKPQIVTTDRATYLDIEVPLQFPYDGYWTELSPTGLLNDYLDTYKMGSVALWALNPMNTESSVKSVTINIWRYLVALDFDAARINAVA